MNCVSPMVKQNSQTMKSISPTSGKKGENEGKLFHENLLRGICVKQVGEMKGNFVFTTMQFQLHRTVLVGRSKHQKVHLHRVRYCG